MSIMLPDFGTTLVCVIATLPFWGWIVVTLFEKFSDERIAFVAMGIYCNSIVTVLMSACSTLIALNELSMQNAQVFGAMMVVGPQAAPLIVGFAVGSLIKSVRVFQPDGYDQFHSNVAEFIIKAWLYAILAWLVYSAFVGVSQIGFGSIDALNQLTAR